MVSICAKFDIAQGESQRPCQQQQTFVSALKILKIRNILVELSFGERKHPAHHWPRPLLPGF